MARHALPNRQELAAWAQTPQPLLRHCIATADVGWRPPGQVVTRSTEPGADMQGYIRDISDFTKCAALQ
jgi:hypothetical protein